MATPVSIKELVEPMELPAEDWLTFVHRDTGEVVSVTRQLLSKAENLRTMLSS